MTIFENSPVSHRYKTAWLRIQTSPKSYSTTQLQQQHQDIAIKSGNTQGHQLLKPTEKLIDKPKEYPTETEIPTTETLNKTTLPYEVGETITKTTTIL